MLKNYARIAWRHLIRHKTHTIINIAGLGLGLACCLFIFLWVRDERGIDNDYPDGDRLYIVYQSTYSRDPVFSTYNTPTSFDSVQSHYLIEDLPAAVPEVKQLAFYAKGYELPWGHAESFRVGDKIMRLKGSRAGKDFLSLFGYPLLEGSPQTALQDIDGIAISRHMAGLFFGSPSGAMGKRIRYENRMDFRVTAVFEDLPQNSSMQFDFLLPFDLQKKFVLEYSSNDFRTYIRLDKSADPDAAAKKIEGFMEARLAKQPGVQTRFGLQRVGDQYLYDHFINGKPAGGRIEYVRLFSGVAIFILIIACINFMNLSTARSVKRAREVGLRKVVGSTRRALIGQFLAEAIFYSFFALLLAIGLLVLFLPAFNGFTGKRIGLPLAEASFWGPALGLVLVTGLIAGSYPALYLSSLQPIRILKGVPRFTQGAIWFRKGLTIFQFVLSIVLIIATLVITRQTAFVQNTHLGYDKDNVIYVRIDGELSKEKNYLSFKQRAAGMPGIAMIDRSTEAPHEMSFVVTDPIAWEGKNKDQAVGFKPASVGYDFVKLMHMEILAGRDFSRDHPSDSADAFLVNEEAVKAMGMKNPIGKWVSAWKKKGHIIGVLKDYHTESLRSAIMPVILDVKEYEDFGVIIARTRPGETKAALSSLEKVYKELNPAYAFTYQFLDQEYGRLYSSEAIISGLSVLFATLAIFISCMGLLGLVMLTAEQRLKEISIRKILGASSPHIVALFSVDFLKLIGIAFLIAAPTAWFFMHRWLQDFAYRLPISWWTFALAASVAMLIALFTIGYQAIKAARANPVVSLRTE